MHAHAGKFLAKLSQTFSEKISGVLLGASIDSSLERFSFTNQYFVVKSLVEDPSIPISAQIHIVFIYQNNNRLFRPQIRRIYDKFMRILAGFKLQPDFSPRNTES